MHENGEVDIRGAYCALAAAKLTNVYTPDMFKSTAEWIAKCQTWEGGFGGCPGMEAHGGYAYCALAALIMLGKTEFCHLPELLVKSFLQLQDFHYSHSCHFAEVDSK